VNYSGGHGMLATPAGRPDVLQDLTTRQLLEEVADRGEALGNADLEYNAQLLIEAMPDEVLNSTGASARASSPR
jgi:hypothetical protein